MYKGIDYTVPDGKGTVKVIFTPCTICGDAAILDRVPMAQIAAWLTGTLIQDAFPGMHPSERELFQTGLHPACYARLLGQAGLAKPC